jgi:hypothetical protein
MTRHLRLISIVSALLLSAASAPAAQSATRSSAPPNAVQESDNPINDQGSSYNYRSNVTLVKPPAPGLSVQVLEFADRLLLRNRTGKTVTVYGYSNEPYARILADGTVQVNTTSPAYFLNQNFYANVTVPAYATPQATPRWTVVDRVGELEWHDHRIHWMSPVPPPQVKDRSRRTKIFDWAVPIQVGARAGSIEGQLVWVPEEGTKTPVAAIVALVAIVLLGGVLVAVVRRRRGAGPTPPASGAVGEARRSGESRKEAW